MSSLNTAYNGDYFHQALFGAWLIWWESKGIFSWCGTSSHGLVGPSLKSLGQHLGLHPAATLHSLSWNSSSKLSLGVFLEQPGMAMVKGAALLAFRLRSCGLDTSETLSCSSTQLQSVPLQTGTFVG